MGIRKHALIVSAICTLFCCVGMNAESSDSAALRLSRFVDNIAAFNHLLPQEKVYLHFDNTSYFIGETIWFKAYVVTAPEHRATDMSRILHVELITREGTIVDRRKLKIENGQCWGEFELKKEYQSGYYEVRAYTHAMLNFGMVQQSYEKEINAFFFNEDYTRRFFQESGTAFSRVFPVYCEPREPGLYSEKTIRERPKVTGKNEPKNPPEKRPEIVFYPEGGHLVKGLMSRVAFEARDEEGRWVEVKGAVEGRRKGPDGRSLGTFTTTHRGKGDFFYIPEKLLKAKVTIEYKGKTYNYELPEPLDEGYVMTVNRDRKGDFLIDVRRSAGQKDEPLGLSVICRGTPYVFESFDLIPESPQTEASQSEDAPSRAGGRTIRVSGGMLPAGVNQITLFNAEGRIFAERLVFVDPKPSAQSFVVSGEGTYSGYHQVKLGFSLSNAVLEADSANSLQNNSFSVSVTDESNRETNASHQTILSNLLLSSDLYGFIEDPDYYFDAGNKKRLHELDLLLMVQGWRRYDWQQMAGIRPFEPSFRTEKDLKVSGVVYPLLGTKRERSRRIGQEGVGIELTMLRDTTSWYGGEGRTDSAGTFAFNLDEFEGDAVVFVKVNEDNSRIQRDTKTDFFDVRDQYGHWPYQYIPIDQGYVPHVRSLDYYETHPMKYVPQKGSSGRKDFTDGESEAWNLQLKEVEVTGRRVLRSIDYSQPAITLDPMEELNLQMDLGMFVGAIEKGMLGVAAAVRHGIRGKFVFTDNRRDAGSIYLLDEHFFQDGQLADEVNLSDTNSPDMENSEEMDRVHDAKYYLRRYLDQSAHESDMLRLVGGNYDTLRYVNRPYLEKVKRICIYADNVNREPYTISSLLSSYSDDFIVNYEFFDDPTVQVPVFQGRRFTYSGYSLKAAFYHPDYTYLNPAVHAPKDYRRTLYWNPDVKLDENGKASIQFYNNSTSTHIVISAEGITGDGTPVVYEK